MTVICNSAVKWDKTGTFLLKNKHHIANKFCKNYMQEATIYFCKWLEPKSHVISEVIRLVGWVQSWRGLVLSVTNVLPTWLAVIFRLKGLWHSWRLLPHILPKLSHCLTTTGLFGTTPTWTITFHLLILYFFLTKVQKLWHCFKYMKHLIKICGNKNHCTNLLQHHHLQQAASTTSLILSLPQWTHLGQSCPPQYQ